ncbi:MAG: hypothetical protein AB7I98_05810 [Verrucomicrobiales bacterium]|nr:hypothetical protein [Verrucomicrobiae bacterium]MCP5553307.1 hypothetical protein [Akkermansiaceae bacterium]
MSRVHLMEPPLPAPALPMPCSGLPVLERAALLGLAGEIVGKLAPYTEACEAALFHEKAVKHKLKFTSRR